MDLPLYRLSAARPKRYTDLTDMVGGNYVQTCSVMFRASALIGIPEWYAGLPIGDWPLYVLLAQRGRIAYIDQTMSAYRVHGGGVWSAGLSFHKHVDDIVGLLDTYAILDRHLLGRYHDVIEKKSSYLHRAAAIALFHDGDFRRAVLHWRTYGRSSGVSAALLDRTLWVKAVRCITSRRDGRLSRRAARNRPSEATGESSSPRHRPAATSQREGP
jgi:hypothetical protein